MPPIHFWGNSSSISNQFLAHSEVSFNESAILSNCSKMTQGPTQARVEEVNYYILSIGSNSLDKYI